MSTDVPLPLAAVLIKLAVFAASVGLVGFFAGSETAFVAMDTWAIDKLSSDGDRRARILKELQADSGNTISALLVGTNVFTVLASAMTASLAHAFGLRGFAAMGLVPVLTTAVLFIFSELVPKSYAAAQPTETALWVAPCLSVTARTLRPVALALAAAPAYLAGVLSRRVRKAGAHSTDEAVRVAIDIAGEDGYVNPDETEVIYGVLDSSDTAVSEVMVPMERTVTFKPDTSLNEALNVFRRCRFSRVPVFLPETRQVTGVVYVKDVMRKLVLPGTSGTEPVMSVARKPHFAQAQDNVLDLLSRLRKTKVHLAVVLNGRQVAGMVTMDDLLEEILGDIPEDAPARALSPANRSLTLHKMPAASGAAEVSDARGAQGVCGGMGEAHSGGTLAEIR